LTDDNNTLTDLNNQLNVNNNDNHDNDYALNSQMTFNDNNSNVKKKNIVTNDNPIVSSNDKYIDLINKLNNRVERLESDLNENIYLYRTLNTRVESLEKENE